MVDESYYSEYTDDGAQYIYDYHTNSTVIGPFGIDPLHFLQIVMMLLFFWVLYLLLPRGIRFNLCGSYPKRYAWSERSKRRRRQNKSSVAHHGGAGSTIGEMSFGGSTVETSSTLNANHKELSAQGIGTEGGVNGVGAGIGTAYSNQWYGNKPKPQSLPEEETVNFTSPDPKTMHLPSYNTPAPSQHTGIPFSSGASTINDEIAISTTLQQLREGGVKIVAHGSKGKPKTVRLVLTENAIEWRTESSKRKNKVGKMHRVPLQHIMYVDVGKQTTALKRVENAAVSDQVCFSLLTKEGSLDLEASSSHERDALVNCFSYVLDEVHAKNWRDVYRAPSSDLPSSFDEFDMGAGKNRRMEV